MDLLNNEINIKTGNVELGTACSKQRGCLIIVIFGSMGSGIGLSQSCVQLKFEKQNILSNDDLVYYYCRRLILLSIIQYIPGFMSLSNNLITLWDYIIAQVDTDFILKLEGFSKWVISIYSIW